MNRPVEDDPHQGAKSSAERQGDRETSSHEARGLGMGKRGVTRPMAESEGGRSMHGQEGGHREHEEYEEHEEHEDGTGQEERGSEEQGHPMSPEQRLEMLKTHHRQTLWVYWTIVMLALWQLVAPFSLGYLNEQLWVDPSGGRGVWWSEQTHTALRAWLMTGSDVLSGLVLLVLGWRSLSPNRPVSLWGCCFVGVWLTVAPVLFWAPTVAAYLNDTLVGAWLIALTILIPGMPNMVMYMQHGPPQPPGWSYNPSSWPQRWIMIVTGLAGWLVSRYLAMFQLGYIPYVWDPAFGFAAGTRPVLNSQMSHGWPISDAGLGGISYTFEFLMGFMGSPSRWRTMPWMVALFGVLVIPLGLTHIILVISQPVIVHHWCLICLLAAAIMLPMIPLEVDEVVAMCQHVVQAKRRGDRDGSLWTIFWKGGKPQGCEPDQRSPQLMTLPAQPGAVLKSACWGVSVPWTLAASAVLGGALMFFPQAMGIDIQSTAADIGHLGGALILTIAVICMGEVLRLGRYLNLLLGAIVAGGNWLLDDVAASYAIACSVMGVLVMLLSVPRGVIKESYGSWDRWVR